MIKENKAEVIGVNEDLWRKFSNIQHAEYIVVDEESMKRFLLWRQTGNEEDAWS